MNRNLRCVIVAVDGTEESMEGLKWAISNLKLQSPVGSSTIESPGSFILLHVQPPPNIAAGLSPSPIPFGGPNLEVPAFTAAIQAHQRRITTAIMDHAFEICSTTTKNVNVKAYVVIGDPKDKICRVIEELHAYLLVIGSRSFGPIKRMFLGSVSQYCAHNAACPVVVVKSKATSS
ncbi:hypothetical protein ACFE04_014369 [Oxalis oulophora]